MKLLCLVMFWMQACSQPPEPDSKLSTIFSRNPDRTPMVSAHRGGQYPGWPENCISTFDFVLSHSPVLIECDVRQTSDGTLIIMHDETVERTTNGRGSLDELTWDYLSGLRLLDLNNEITEFKIPRLRETLRWAKENAILTLDIKDRVAFESVVKMIDEEDAKDNVILITYTIGAAKQLHSLDPELMLSVTIRNQPELERLKNTDIPMDQVVAFIGTRMAEKDLLRDLHRNQIYSILGTIGNLDRQAESLGDQVYLNYIEEGIDIITTDRPIEVAAVISGQWGVEARIVKNTQVHGSKK